MSDDETPVLVCVRVDDLPRPSVRSYVDTCESCQLRVWRSVRSAQIGRPFRVLCVACTADELDEHPDAELKPATYVAEDLAEIRRRGLD